jgi:mannose-6-phosphate isomerase-like protein (cupin superfamily)
MRCRKARALTSLYLAPHASELSSRSRQALEAHMATCALCRRDYEESGEALAWLREHWQISPDTRLLLQDTCPQAQGRSFGKATPPRWRVGRVAAWAMATAACLIAGLLGLRATSNRDAAVAEWQAPSRAFSGGDEYLVIEWRDDRSRITPGAAIETAPGEVRGLVLNGKHQVVMNAGTRLSIEPYVERSSTGCAVNLNWGEVYVHVEHDGNPFTVRTAHGQAVITGTTFDLKATEVATSLVVVEGQVRFESGTGAVQVTAGQRSIISGTLTPPDAPVACHTPALTAWAGAEEGVCPLARDIVPYGDFLPNAAPFPPPGTRSNFEGVEYTRWVQLNRDWFQREFPGIFRLQAALVQDGVEVDYPDLLLESGLVWQFAFPPASQNRLLAAEDAAVLKLASRYGRDPSWLEDRGLRPGATIGNKEERKEEAWERWRNELATVDGGREIPREVLLNSLHACVYVRQTRSLVWLAAEADRYSRPNLSKTQLQSLLQAEVTAANEGRGDALRLLSVEGPTVPCDSDPYRQLLRRLCQMVSYLAQMEESWTNEMAYSRP